MTDLEIDQLVGKAIRAKRKELLQSQQALADALGVSFQQLQKYESGANRVSASKLWRIARAQVTPISYYFTSSVEATESGEAAYRCMGTHP
jgi:transcriptional regulator with XRE-family HTH domain